MATIKAYTDLEQSKKLAEILPPESADNFIADVFDKEKETHSYNFHILSTWGCNTFKELKDRENNFVHFTPCWSLAALLEFLSANFRIDTKYLDNYWELDCRVQVTYNKALIDACYEMIVKLHEQKRL